MKKPKRPITWEKDDEEDLSERTIDESEETEFDLSREGFDEEEIIDLEDIIEFSDDDQHGGTLGLDVDILDDEPREDDAGDLYSSAAGKETKQDPFDDDLLKGFSLAEEESFRMDTIIGGEKSLEFPQGGEELLSVRGEDASEDAGASTEDLLEREPISDEKDISLEEEEVTSPPDLPTAESGDDAIFEFETGVLMKSEESQGSQSGQDIHSGLENKRDDVPLESKAIPQAPSIEEFVSHIESRLLEAVREIVESKLPEVVRAALKEEIERLKEEYSD